MSDSPPVLRLAVSLHGGELGAAIAQGTLLHKARVAYDAERVAGLSARVVGVLARGARQRALTQAALAELRTLGEDLYRSILPAATREDLAVAEYAGAPLLLELDEALVAVPWELLHDGRGFWCRRFELGRAVVTAAPRRTGPGRRLARPARMMVLCSDPRGDLLHVADEGQAIVDALDAHQGVSVRLAAGRGVEFARNALRDHDLVHFAGHADVDRAGASGWHLADGKLSAAAVAELADGRSLPLLVFANACASAHEAAPADGRAAGMTSAFLQAGVRYVIGTQWEIVDAHSRVFATAFYSELGRGRTLGAAVRRAREAVIVAEGEGALGWASYVLYGDPTATLFAAEDAPRLPVLPTPAQISQRESLKGVVKRIARVRPGKSARPRVWPFVVAAVLLAAGAAAFALVR